jgi:hypothetical protein
LQGQAEDSGHVATCSWKDLLIRTGLELLWSLERGPSASSSESCGRLKLDVLSHLFKSLVINFKIKSSRENFLLVVSDFGPSIRCYGTSLGGLGRGMARIPSIKILKF